MKSQRVEFVYAKVGIKRKHCCIKYLFYLSLLETTSKYLCKDTQKRREFKHTKENDAITKENSDIERQTNKLQKSQNLTIKWQ